MSRAMPLAAVEAELDWAIRTLLLTKATTLVVDDLDLSPLENLELTAKVIAIGLDTLGRRLVGDRDFTEEEIQLGTDLIDTLPDTFTADELVEILKARLAAIR